MQLQPSRLPKWLKQRQKRQRIWLGVLALILLVWLFGRRGPSLRYRRLYPSTPLVRKYIDFGYGTGGRFFIPAEWYLDVPIATANVPNDDFDYWDLRNPRGPAEAANQALALCLRQKLYLEHTQIPLIIHQTWKNFESDTWSPVVRDSVEAWLRLATGQEFGKKMPRMSYIMWDDLAVEWFMKRYENSTSKSFNNLPYNVEKADVFRIAVLKWFGGIYADIDTRPLQHPTFWVKDSDMGPWSNPAIDETYRIEKVAEPSFVTPKGAPPRPGYVPDSPWDFTMHSYKKELAWHGPANDTVAVRAIVGIEGDNPPDTDDYWRMGYTYPVQLTNWAFAMSPQHPVTQKYLANVWKHVKSMPEGKGLDKVDPLNLTGPPVFTQTVMEHAAGVHGSSFDWNALSGRRGSVEIGGRGKIVAGDVMVLPITGFSPGRGKFHNMGSMPISHKAARLYHAAAGSWRKSLDVKVQAGKICRTVLGQCRDWDKWAR